jgi:hypothetical protein
MKAKRGDLVVVEYLKDYSHDGADFEVEKVASITREGEVRSTIRLFGHKDSEPEPMFRVQTSGGRPYRRYRCYFKKLWVIPSAAVDGAAMWAAWDARTDVKGWFPESFKSIEAAKDFMQAFRTEVAA